MKRLSGNFSWLFTVFIFLLTLLGLLFDFGQLILTWASFISAVALVLGAFNLFVVHIRRSYKLNGYSIILVVGMLLVWLSPAIERVFGVEDWASLVFYNIQAPLEAALSSLLFFFLLFAGIRIFQRQIDWVWSTIFGITTLIVLLGTATLPSAFQAIIYPIYTLITEVIVNAGVRAILIGVALGTITMSIRVLVGAERPYNK